MDGQTQGLWPQADEGNAPPAAHPREGIERALGMVATPPELVDFMVGLGRPADASPLRVLEPACGDSPFLRAFAHRYGTHHDLTGVDIHPEAVERARAHLPHARFLVADYLLWQPEEPFDLILGTPPYGIIGDASRYPIHLLKERKSAYRQRFATWRGKYNIYGAFIEHSVRLLRPGGRLVFVVPATWLVLDDFADLRQFLAGAGRLTVHYWGRAFPGRNVSVVVLLVEKGARGMALCEKGEVKCGSPRTRGNSSGLRRLRRWPLSRAVCRWASASPSTLPRGARNSAGTPPSRRSLALAWCPS
ncbi:MAG: HsdM family class I SAM-dependent methyltransferase [Anaerolineae bacterium]